MQNFDVELDARGLNCPLPIMKAKKTISTLAAGQRLKVITTDPGAVADMSAFCKQTGNELLESLQQNGEFLFLIKKSSQA